MHVPRDPDEVLPGASPIAGDPEEAHAAAVFLTRVVSGCSEYALAVSAAGRQLSANVSVGIARLESSLAAEVLPGAVTLARDAGTARQALRSYGEQIEDIHRAAERAREGVREDLQVIRVQAGRIEDIGWQIGVSPSYAWDAGAPPVMPEPQTRAPAGATVEESAMQARIVYERYEWDWRAAARQWQEAIARIETARVRWRNLYADRVEAERRLLGALHATELGGLLHTSGAASASVGSAVAVAYVQRLWGGEDSPATRRAHPLLKGLTGTEFDRDVLGRRPTAEQVAAWWRSLGDADREKLIAEAPLVVGNLDGIPLDTRIEANAVTAALFSKAPGITGTERTYWERVAAGRINLAVSDPEKYRLVEMLGKVGPDTRRVVTYVPGTSASLQDFYGGGVQKVAKYLVKYSPNDSTVAFVYKDGAWPAWAASNRNSNDEALARLGREVEGFQRDVIGREQAFRDLNRDAIGHSAAMTIVSGAENAGAEFDHVLSLGGSYMLPGWTPNTNTDYHHFQYEGDAINLVDKLEGKRGTPHLRDDVYRQHIYDAEGQGSLRSHGRIAEGPETNLKPLKGMLDVLQGDKK